MINEEAAKRIEELMQEYKFHWNKEVEFVNIPPGLTQEKLVTIMERIVETGESILAGYSKCFPSKYR